LVASILRKRGFIVFKDWSKHVAAGGIDLAAYEPTSGELWHIDNKAQFGGIGGADALSGPQYGKSAAEMEELFKTTWPNKAEADLALKAIHGGKVRKVVANAFAGEATRFAPRCFDKGLSVFDIRTGQMFEGTPLGRKAWLEAYTSLKTLRRAIRVTGVRGAASVEGSLIVMVASGSALLILRGGGELKTIVGEVIADAALGWALSRFPGGFWATMVVGMESDESPGARAARKKKETIDYIMGDLPKMSPADEQATRDVIKQMLEEPVILQPPDTPPPTPGLQLPGFKFPPLRSAPWA
jgi:hypothetical protein